MRRRSISAVLVATALLVPVTASSAAAATGGSAVGSTFKNSDAKREKSRLRATVQVPPSLVRPVGTAPTTPPPSTPAPYADRVLALTNVERTARALRPLAFSGCADTFANSWARSLSAAGSLSHQSLTPIMTTCKARSAGENVAYGNVSPEELVQMWMESPGHRANILNAAFTHLGVGDVTTSAGRVYGVQVFLTL